MECPPSELSEEGPSRESLVTGPMVRPWGPRRTTRDPCRPSTPPPPPARSCRPLRCRPFSVLLFGPHFDFSPPPRPPTLSPSVANQHRFSPVQPDSDGCVGHFRQSGDPNPTHTNTDQSRRPNRWCLPTANMFVPGSKVVSLISSVLKNDFPDNSSILRVGSQQPIFFPLVLLFGIHQICFDLTALHPCKMSAPHTSICRRQHCASKTCTLDFELHNFFLDPVGFLCGLAAPSAAEVSSRHPSRPPRPGSCGGWRGPSSATGSRRAALGTKPSPPSLPRRGEGGDS